MSFNYREDYIVGGSVLSLCLFLNIFLSNTNKMKPKKKKMLLFLLNNHFNGVFVLYSI